MGRPKKIQNQTNQTNQKISFQSLENESPNIESSESEEIKNKIEDLKTNFVNENNIELEKKEKKATGSNYKSKKVIAEEKQQIADSISGIGSFALGMIVKRLPNPIPLSIEEKTQFDLMFNKVVYKYSDYLGAYSEEFALLTITVMIAFPRLQNPKKENKESVKKDTEIIS